MSKKIIIINVKVNARVFSAASFRLGRTRARSNVTCGRIHACGAATYHALCWKTSPSWGKFRVPNCGLPGSRSSLSTIVVTSAMFENASAKWRGFTRRFGKRPSRFRRRQIRRRRGRSFVVASELGRASLACSSRAEDKFGEAVPTTSIQNVSLSPLYLFFYKNATISFLVRQIFQTY